MAATGGGAPSAPLLVPVHEGRYLREVHSFGRGSFGEVFEAVPAEMKRAAVQPIHGSRRVCLKLINLPASGLGTEQTREIELWSALDHPNVAPLRDWFLDSVATGRLTKRYLGLVTDLYDHGSLRLVLERDEEEKATASRESRPPRLFLSLRKVVSIAKGVLAGLDFLHTREPPIIHRDLKPENVCLGVACDVDFVESSDGSPCRVWASDDNLEVKIIDFGTSEERFEQLFSGGTLGHGTIAYMGPQRAVRGKYSGLADDCWAAGLLLAECMLGEGIGVLFPTVCDARVSDTPEILRLKLPHGRPDELEAVVSRCEFLDPVLGRLVRGLLTIEEEARWSSGRALGELEMMTTGSGRLVRAEMAEIHSQIDALRDSVGATQSEASVVEKRLRELEHTASQAEERISRVEHVEAELRAQVFRAEAAALAAIARAERAESAVARLLERVEELERSRARVDEDEKRALNESLAAPILPSKELFRLQGNSSLIVSIEAHKSLPLLFTGGGDWGWGSRDYRIRVWDLTSRSLVRILDGHRGFVNDLAVDPKGRILASGSRDNTVKLWNVESGELLRTLEGRSRDVFCVEWNPDGSRLASGSSDCSVRIWEVDAGAVRHNLTGHSKTVTNLVTHPDAELLASSSDDKTVRVWSWSSGATLHILLGHSSNVHSLDASASWIVSGSGDRTVRVWSWSTGACVHVLDSFTQIIKRNALCWRGRSLVALEGEDRKESGLVRMWDTLSHDPTGWTYLGAVPSPTSSGEGIALLDGGLVAFSATRESTAVAVWGV